MENYDQLIPDFDLMQALIDQLAEARAREFAVKNHLKEKEADVVREAMLNRDLWEGTKPPTMSYCDKVVSVLGNNDKDKEDLFSTRRELASTMEVIERLQGTIQVMRDKLDLYRTFSANERKAHI